MLEELADANKNMGDRKRGYVGVTISPFDGSKQEVKLLKPQERKSGCGGTCECKSRSLKFRDVLDDIENVIFNDPATIVTFKDGSKVCVKACKNDTFSKETGLIYAIVKRLYANDRDENGYMKSKGLGEKISKVIDKAFDQKKAEAEHRAKLRAKAKAKEAKKLEKEANDAAEKAAKEAVDQVYDPKNG